MAKIKKQNIKKILQKAKNSKPTIRVSQPSNKKHKSKKDYKRIKVKVYATNL